MSTATETPTADLTSIRKSIEDLRRQERAAVRKLPSAEWTRDRRQQEARKLSGSKTVDVDVDWEIDKDDLADLGYHHEDDCPATGVEIAPARQALADWHDLNHGYHLWSACTEEPCNVLTREFRTDDHTPML